MRTLIRKAFGIRSRTQINERREQLTEAQSTLKDEAAQLERDVQSVGRRDDPIDVIIRNIKRANRR